LFGGVAVLRNDGAETGLAGSQNYFRKFMLAPEQKVYL
jgi:hypothetical protein